jgi:hypothetical protein
MLWRFLESEAGLMKKWLAFLLAVALAFVLHEGLHILTASLFGELEAFHVRSLGFEVTFRTPVEARSGIHWAFISGFSNLATLLLGYLLLWRAKSIARSTRGFWLGFVYYLTLTTLFLDAFNLSLGPFIYGGDANGIAAGLGISRYVIQGVFFMVLLINRELIAQSLLPAYSVAIDHPLFRPWIRLGKRGQEA